MKTLPAIIPDFPLQRLNTFGINATAAQAVVIDQLDQLAALAEQAELMAQPRLILGGGSNLVLADRVQALVLHLRLLGKSLLSEDAEHFYVQAAGGENWHEFVLWTLAQGYGGLENLSLIPGTVGAAPVQNIGAYGVEVKDLLHQLTVFDLAERKLKTLSNAECRFAYRDSIFKTPAGRDWVIVNVVFALPRQWQPRLAYAELSRYLQQQGDAVLSPTVISKAVIAIRRAKLPDPAQIGNAGSFFKNPLVEADCKNALEQRYPNLVSYPQPDGRYKLAAGWLIDQCGWKGRRLGAAGVYEKQALVLVNHGGASGADIRALATAIQADVQARFGVTLEAEPVFVN